MQQYGVQQPVDALMDRRRVYVGNVPWHIREAELQSMFSNLAGRYARVTDVRLVYEKHTGRSKGFGFITYQEEADAELAKALMNGQIVQGRQIRVGDAAPPGSGQGTAGSPLVPQEAGYMMNAGPRSQQPFHGNQMPFHGNQMPFWQMGHSPINSMYIVQPPHQQSVRGMAPSGGQGGASSSYPLPYPGKQGGNPQRQQMQRQQDSNKGYYRGGLQGSGMISSPGLPAQQQQYRSHYADQQRQQANFRTFQHVNGVGMSQDGRHGLLGGSGNLDHAALTGGHNDPSLLGHSNGTERDEAAQTRVLMGLGAGMPGDYLPGAGIGGLAYLPAQAAAPSRMGPTQMGTALQTPASGLLPFPLHSLPLHGHDAAAAAAAAAAGGAPLFTMAPLQGLVANGSSGSTASEAAAAAANRLGAVFGYLDDSTASLATMLAGIGLGQALPNAVPAAAQAGRPNGVPAGLPLQFMASSSSTSMSTAATTPGTSSSQPEASNGTAAAGQPAL